MTRSDSFPRLLTANETADLLRTSRKAVYAMAERGQLPGVTRIRRRLLVRADDLRELQNGRCFYCDRRLQARSQVTTSFRGRATRVDRKD